VLTKVKIKGRWCSTW